ncbi:DsbA family oxidoreductase [uncultured Paraglaciecola sp.]|uniref:DsbA family oxidoreductase n=1 Tax=uncultured Paraglaciecola sp. TaxID=1765024 RepID=UPI0030DB4562|tara:strand:+ start:32698 stop:33348 length:651 start_codon:yes stop_codon:yes gene_type:complete
MPHKLKIDIISDVVCPWCIIGYRNLQQAITELGVQDQVEIEWQPFELNPDMPPEGENLREHSARKYGSTPESSARFRQEMSQRGNDVGFSFDYFDAMKIVNTRQAHILLEFAKDFNLQTALKLRLFSAFFTEHKDISDRNVLAQEIAAVGLDVNAAMLKLDSGSAFSDVQEKETQWHSLGVSSVPTVVINRTTGISGAQPVEAFKEFIAAELDAFS